MSVNLNPALAGLVGSTSRQQLDGVEYRLSLLWLDETPRMPFDFLPALPPTTTDFLTQAWRYRASTMFYQDETADAQDPDVGDVFIFQVAVSASVNDAFYVGNDRPFQSITYDISTAGNYSIVIAWEYWDGSAWAALGPLVDDTDSFQTTGVNTVSFVVPDDWEQVDVNGVTAYYVRSRIDVINSYTGFPVATTIQVTTPEDQSLTFGEPGVWTLALAQSDGTTLISGQLLRHGVNVLAGFRGDARFPGQGFGQIIAWDYTGLDRDPGREDLDPGSDVRLVYRTAAEVLAG